MDSVSCVQLGAGLLTLLDRSKLISTPSISSTPPSSSATLSRLVCSFQGGVACVFCFFPLFQLQCPRDLGAEGFPILLRSIRIPCVFFPPRAFLAADAIFYFDLFKSTMCARAAFVPCFSCGFWGLARRLVDSSKRRWLLVLLLVGVGFGLDSEGLGSDGAID